MRPTTTQPLLLANRLSASYRARGGLFQESGSRLIAVDEVDLAIGRGEILGLAGESGSGKSTIARLICQLLTPDTGSIYLDGEPLEGMGKQQRLESRRRIQMIFQDPSAALSPRRSVRQSLLEPLVHFGIGSPPEREQMAIEALAAVDLEASAMHRFPHQFSSGQRQRISIARALLANPDVLVADEPVSSLDVSVQGRILRLLGRLRAERDIAILFISHDLAVIRQLADTVGVMLKGRMVEYAPAKTIFERPAHPYTRQLLAATTDPDPDRARADDLVTTMAMSARDRLSPGCSFFDRCPDALTRCEQELPLSRANRENLDHVVKCHLIDPEEPR